MSSGISFFYGHTEWGRNDGLTEALFTRLGDVVRRRVEESGDEGLWRGGMVVDTPAEFAKKDKHAMIMRCVREFESEPNLMRIR
jgi:polyribonucleotide 5'-hydroxyl-kinase